MTEYTNDHHLNVDKFLSTFNLQFGGTCPHCQYTVHPSLLSWSGMGFSINRLPEKILAIVSCPHCNEQYFEVFSNAFLFESRRNTYNSSVVYPSPAPALDLPSEVLADYPQFHKIYLEAATAESMQLLEICGMGYRKALEFLLKTYASEQFPDQKDTIETEPLMSTIRRLPTPKLTTLAQAAAWLGNDQTHLVAKHPEYDLQQLKAFIKVLCQHIQAETEFQKALELTQKPK